MKKAYIFDLDGTLTNTLYSITYSTNRTLERMGLLEITEMQCRAFVGNGARVLIEKAVKCTKPDADAAFVDRALAIYLEIFSEYCSYKVEPYEGIVALLESLKADNIKLAVLSNKPHEMAVKAVQEVFGDGYFDYVQGQSDSLPRKPDARSVAFVLDQLGVVREDCVYVGDSEVDIQTGRNAKVTTVAVDWGFRDRAVLELEQPTEIVSKACELLKFR